jgi:hypothetical protein
MLQKLAFRGAIALSLLVCCAFMTGCPSDKVVVIDNFPEFSLDRLWNDFVSFFYWGDDSSPLEVGDIIVGTGGGGFLRRLTGVDHSGDKVNTETEFVSLAEAIDDGTLNADVTFTPDDFAKSGVPLAKAGGTTIDLSGLVIFSKDGVSLKISHGSITVAPTITLDAQFSDHKLVAFKAITETDLAIDLNLMLSATGVQNLNWETDIIPPISKPFVFYIGPVPVVGVASLSFPFGVAGSVQGTISGESGFDGTSHVKIGTQLAGGKWSDVSQLGTFQPTAHPLVIRLSSDAGLDVYVKVKAGLNLYGCSNLTGFVQPYVATDAKFIPSPLVFVLSAGINGGIGYQLGIFDFNLIDKNWYFPGPQWELFRYTLPYDIPTTFTIQWPF